MGLRLSGYQQNNHIKSRKLIIAISSYFQNPSVPHCMLIDLKDIALPSVHAKYRYKLIKKLPKELALPVDIERPESNAISVTMMCFLLIYQFESTGYVTISSPPCSKN